MAETGTQTISPAGAHMEAELVSQPDCWEQAAEVARDTAVLPAAGLRVAAIGCGTSWFMAQSYAALREAAGQGQTDAFAASEAPAAARDYDAVVLITRSGTTTEVLELAAELRGRVHTVGIVGDTASPFPDAVDDLVALPFADETSVVQTRFATSALSALRASLGHDVAASAADARQAISAGLPSALVDADQITLLGRGWTVGLAHEAALKMREAAQSWTESYPAMEYRHGPISIAAPGRVVWAFGAAPDGLAADVAATGARFEASGADPLAELVRAQRVALARARARGLDPDRPRNLTRSVILG
ncbi:SIS domain-containing protein [Microbacterium sp. NPDC055683]